MPIGFSVPLSVSATRDLVKTIPVTLAATAAYTDVHINVVITKPSGSFIALMATDTAGNTFDIAELGYWGPSGGFDVPAGYNATTDVSGIFSMAGEYRITLTVTADSILQDTKVITVTVAEGDSSQKILVRRGLEVNLPLANATAYELLYATDSQELYVADVNGNPQELKLPWDRITEKPTPEIELTGDATGSGSLTDAGATINVTVVDGSHHNHTIDNVDGLQDALDDKSDIGHGHSWSDITDKPDPQITLSGDVAGSGTMTDVGNVDITVTVQDDSHNHIISNVDGLQEALDDLQDALAHDHDIRYYTKAQINAMIAVVDGGTF